MKLLSSIVICLFVSFSFGCKTNSDTSEHWKKTGDTDINLYAYPDGDKDSSQNPESDSESDSIETTEQEIEELEIIESPIDPTINKLPKPECKFFELENTRHSNLNAVNGKWYLFYAQKPEQHDFLYVMQSDFKKREFSKANLVAAGARSAEVIDKDGELYGLVARQFYKILMTAPYDASKWTDIGRFPNEKTYNCDGFEHSFFFAGPKNPEYVLLNFDYNTGIFGCINRLYMSKRNGDEWTEPKIIGQGYADFAADFGDAQLVVSTHGVLISKNNGETFTKLQGGNYTNNQLKGTGSVLPNNDILMAQSYNWASENHLAVLKSTTKGATWMHKIILQKGGSYQYVKIESYENLVIVSYKNGSTLYIMLSPDGGKSWSEPSVFYTPKEDEGIFGYSLQIYEKHVGASKVITEKGNSWKPKGIMFCESEYKD